ncbi:fimbrial protein [Kluyvera genomosp. 1]|uniref:fimbrial protein n=1 Tax=Kluyvera genomosp. 1 TaxID=2774053 RepID=UPI00092D469D|nr:fimbrial protein [Kluyvera genomosp. 1]
MRNVLRYGFCLLVALIGTGQVWASCSLSPYGYETRNVNIGSVTVPRDATSGTVLTTVAGAPWEMGQDLWGCTTSWTYIWSMRLFSVRSELADVYKTNITGVGIRLTDVSAGKTLPYTMSMAANQYARIGSGIQTELVKIDGAVSGGNLTLGKLAVASISGFEDTGDVKLTSGTITKVACSLGATKALTFNLGDIPLSNFSDAVGYSPSSNQDTQSLALDCDAGANVNVTLQGSQNPDVGTNTVLELTGQGGAGVAQGVGVQILYNGTPLVLGSKLLLKQSAGGQETFPFVARYYQTRTTVVEGSANTSATLSITYQ